jgi:enamine deaminase RidA (YjgF/YER057c/UK114 family)
MAVEYINPEGMHRNPVYSQGIAIPAGARLLLVGGQNAVDGNGAVVGKGDIGAQTDQAVKNVLGVVAAAGGTIQSLVEVTIMMLSDQPLGPAFAAWMAHWGQRPNPPTVSMMRVVGLANPDYLIEIKALAVLS